MWGMTGFGHANARIESARDVEISVEIRSTNHRFLEILFHLPEGFSYLEEPLRKLICAKTTRGRVTVSVNTTGRPRQKVSVDKRLLRDYIKEIKELRKETGGSFSIDAGTLLTLPGVLSVQEAQKDKSVFAAQIIKLTAKALSDFVRMRRVEGAAIQSDVRQRISDIIESVTQIKARFAKAVEARVGKLKLQEEKSSFIKNSDITEELVRIKCHLDSFRGSLNKGKISGKELDFISQEIQREVNTVGAKSIDAEVSAGVVKVKSQIEKIREQIQNIE